MKARKIGDSALGWATLVLMSLNCTPGLIATQANAPAAQVQALIDQFNDAQVFWQQLEVAKKIVGLKERRALPQLEKWLTHEDRHVRGNAAFVFASLGDNRGFDVIDAILTDRSYRPAGQGLARVYRRDRGYHVEAQIQTDRYYAVHLFGELKDPRAVPILIPLLKDKDINYKVAWSLGQIRDRRAIPPLIEALGDINPSVRVHSIYALEQLSAREAVPRLRELLSDEERTNFGATITVAEAAEAALAKLESKR